MTLDALEHLIARFGLPTEARPALVALLHETARSALDTGNADFLKPELDTPTTIGLQDTFSAATSDAHTLHSQLRAGGMDPNVTMAPSGTLLPPGELGTEPELSTDSKAPEFGGGSRYALLGQIGQGGMGEVWRVHDRDLGRALAMKVIRTDLVDHGQAVARFIEEAQVGAQLQHPGLVPVHELGTLPDGRFYFTMQEIEGRQFGDAIEDVHLISQMQGRWSTSASGWSLQRLIRVFTRVCEAVGFAHARGVVHCDIKPSNIVVGENDEVFVLDWGVARLMGRSEGVEGAIETDRSQRDHLATRDGTVRGTPQYMAPEQAAGRLADVSPRTDVYSLGIVLYQILAGQRPYTGHEKPAMQCVLEGIAPTPVEEAAALPLPEELAELCAWAMSLAMDSRPDNARDLASTSRAWLEGTRRRERALSLIEEAQAMQAQADQMRIIAEALDTQSAALLGGIPANAPEAIKYPAWTLEDEAHAKRRQAALKEIDAELRFQAALTHEPTLEEIHTALAERYGHQHKQAIKESDEAEAQRAEAYLRTHIEALPGTNPVRAHLETYLKGTGAVSLVTDPPGAEVLLYTHEMQNRRLVPSLVRSLGRTPLSAVPLAPGSHLLVLRKNGHQEVRYPIFIEREAHWDGVRPGAEEPTPIWLPPLGALEPEERYVPAGRYLTQGPDTVPGARPRQWIWVDGFITRRFPVTHADYLRFINALAREGRHDDIRRWVAQERSGGVEAFGPMIYTLDEATGRYAIKPDSDGDLLPNDSPVVLVDFESARAYAEWFAKTAGKPWRLMIEDEREKATRGVDGRAYPWGDFHDPSRSHMSASHAASGQGMIAVVDSYPIDISPYGVRGGAGNSVDWTLDTPEIADLPPERTTAQIVEAALACGPEADRVLRGGGWVNNRVYCHLSRRHFSRPSTRLNFIGFRIARPL